MDGELTIANTDSFSIHTPQKILFFKDVLHCPDVMLNLLSINKFCVDNNYFFHPSLLSLLCEGQNNEKNASGGDK